MKPWRLLLKKDNLSIAVLFTAATFIIFSSLSSFAQTPNTYDWTDDNLSADAVQSGTRIPIKQTHIQELRTRINAKRVECLMGNYPWTDSTLQTGQTKVRKVHIDQLRQAVQQIYDHHPASRPRIPASFTDPTITAYTTPVRATHIQELRTAIENATCCGDNAINGPEQCDRNQLGGATCVSLGYSGGTLACIPPDDTNHGCEFDISGCYLCGDGTCEPLKGENCPNCPLPECCCPDGDCFDPGENCDTCEADCGVCPYCGDGNADTSIGEECDGSDLEGKTCITQGFSNGTLSCNSECKFDTSGCSCAAPIINTVNCLNDSSAGPVEIFYTENACSNIKEFRLVRAGQPGIVMWRPNLSYCDWAGSYCMYLGGANPGDQTIWIEAYDDYYPAGNLVATSNSVNFNCCGDETCATKYETPDNCPVDCVICQNGIIEGDEECDGDDFDEKTCEDILGAGYTGTLSCDENCSIDTSGCTAPPLCPNGSIDAGEDCDGANLNGKTCASVLGAGYTGTLTCKSNCTFDTSACIPPVTCPNGKIDSGEQCDGSNLNGKTCITQGWSCGAISCNSNCTLNTTLCGCCDNNVDPGEQCDGANLDGETCQTLGYDIGNLACTSQCKFNTAGCSNCNWTGWQDLQCQDYCPSTRCPAGQKCQVNSDNDSNCDDQYRCVPDSTKCPYCGDGICNGTETTASCPGDCPDTERCGNNIYEGTNGEDCDGTDLGNCGCITICGRGGVPGGFATCNSDCTCNCSMCMCGNLICDNGETKTTCPGDCGCGNGVINTGESCDGSNLNAQTCLTQGFGGGTLTCNSTCTGFITSSCFSCTGTTPTNATMCSSDDTGLTANTAKTLVDTCGTAKCEYTCNTYYYRNGTVCTPFPCDGPAPSFATMCSGDDVNVPDSTTRILVSSCSVPTGTKCEYTCNSGYTKIGSACCNMTGWVNAHGCPFYSPPSCNGNNDPACYCNGEYCYPGQECQENELVNDANWTLDRYNQCGGTSYRCAAKDYCCGGGTIGSGEQCDGTNLNGKTCTTLGLGFEGGTLSCTYPLCQFDTTGCYDCGNGTCESAKGETGANCPGDCCPITSYSWQRQYIGCGVACGTKTCGGMEWCEEGTLSGCPNQYRCVNDDHADYCYLDDYKNEAFLKISKK